MFQFIQNIAELLNNIIGVVIHALTFLIELFTTIPAALSYIIGVVALLPPYVGGVILVSISVSVILMIINHGGD